MGHTDGEEEQNETIADCSIIFIPQASHLPSYKSNSKFVRNMEGTSFLKVLCHSVYMLDEISKIPHFSTGLEFQFPKRTTREIAYTQRQGR